MNDGRLDVLQNDATCTRVLEDEGFGGWVGGVYNEVCLYADMP